MYLKTNTLFNKIKQIIPINKINLINPICFQQTNCENLQNVTFYTIFINSNNQYKYKQKKTPAGTQRGSTHKGFL